MDGAEPLTDTKKIVFKFEEGVLSYRNTDEGSLIKKLYYLDQHYDTAFYSEWTLFKVKHSDYLGWFLEDSSGIYESNKVEHYVFITPNEVIEIISANLPQVIIDNP
ncbi:hypothetical protein [Hazenella coriacea]|uniref:Uncharacterized protein n=1 Tax=Hazenella coriacea TaxID=1179467 RepID=A0A4R3L6X6_9BACL|nr:hypothetical protein [Hazenella coriacea]TCS93246.1 hypothetical protein EDD58_10860 [Hazenella coriacea]